MEIESTKKKFVQSQYDQFLQLAAIPEMEREESARAGVLFIDSARADCHVCMDTRPQSELWHSTCPDKHVKCYDCVPKFCYRHEKYGLTLSVLLRQ